MYSMLQNENKMFMETISFLSAACYSHCTVDLNMQTKNIPYVL